MPLALAPGEYQTTAVGSLTAQLQKGISHAHAGPPASTGKVCNKESHSQCHYCLFMCFIRLL